MSTFQFLLGPGHLPEAAAAIAEEHGADLVNYTEPSGEQRHWFSGPNLGAPFDRDLERDVRTALEAAGLLDEGYRCPDCGVRYCSTVADHSHSCDQDDLDG